MTRTSLIASAIIGASLIAHSVCLAEGKGNGLNRGLSAASKGVSNGGMTRAGGALPRADGGGRGPLRNGASFGRASGGLQRANAAAGPTIEMPDDGGGQSQALSNQQSILNHRLDQADHLRAVSEANGNDHLLDTADRMEGNANRNFARQQGRLSGASSNPTGSASGDTSDRDSMPAQSVGPTIGTSPSVPMTTNSGRRGLWFRSR